MKRLFVLLSSLSIIHCTALPAFNVRFSPGFPYSNETHDLTTQIPQMLSIHAKYFQKVPNVAQYGKADWSNVIGISHNISLNEAFQLAAENGDVNYFFYNKQWMTLVTDSGETLTFRPGDAVFFSGEPWWGEAKGFADGYIKICIAQEY